MKIKQRFKEISNNLGSFVHNINRIGVNDGYPNDINQILKLEERKWSGIGGSNLKTEDDDYALHHRNIRAASNTLEEYFINNGRGFNHPDVIRNIDGRNFNVEIYSRYLSSHKLAKATRDIISTFKTMRIGMPEYPREVQTIKLYIFNNHNDYRHYGNKFQLGIGDEGGKHYYIGRDNILSKIYLYQDGDVFNVAHEIVHANVAYITGGKQIPIVVNEGIAEKVQYTLSKNFNAQGSSVDVTRKELMGDYNLRKILTVTYSDNYEQNTLVYKLGHALIMYLDWKDPEILKSYLRMVGSSKNLEDANKILYEHYDKEEFKTFLVDHSTETEMKSINALKVECGEKIATVQEIIGQEIKPVTYYEANIRTIDRVEIVGKFAPVYHKAIELQLRITSADNKGYFNISQNFHFMKVIKHMGELKLVYCDKYGNAYKDSPEYQEALKNIKMQYSSEEDYNNIKERLTYFGLNSVRNVKKQDFLEYFVEDAVFTLKALDMHPAKLSTGISIYKDEEKIGELTSDTTVVKQIGNHKSIVHSDRLTYTFENAEEVYIAICEKDQEYKMFFIEGRKVEADRYFSTPHIHLVPSFEPSINSIEPNYIMHKLLIKNTEILDHADSENSKYSESHRASKHTIEKGALLDNYGTEREIDDVYEAEIVHLGSKIDIFRNIGFYISECGSFFIQDYGKGLRYQFPKSITHLKLIKLKGNDGTIIKRLVPVTQDGNEFPDGMPNIPDKYRLINPIFAHKYEKEDHSHQHLTVGLINFNTYEANSLFKIQYDPNDYHIRRDKQGNILRLSDRTVYMTKVKIYDESGIELGMFSNDLHQFLGKIFISFDYNYSYKDFLMSYAPKIEYKFLPDGTKAVMFVPSESDISNNNYHDYKRVPISESTKFSRQSDALISEEHQYAVTNFDQNIPSKNLVSPYSVNIPTISIDSDDQTLLVQSNNHGTIGVSIITTVSAIGAVLGLLYYKFVHLRNKSQEHDDSNHTTTSEPLLIPKTNDLITETDMNLSGESSHY